MSARAAFVLAATAVFGAALVAGMTATEDDGVDAGEIAARSVASVPSLMADRPREAALQALAAERLDSSIASELAMLGIAIDGSGIERVVPTGSKHVTAAIRTERFLVTAGADRRLRVWRAANGALVGGVRTGRPLVALAGSESIPLLAASDQMGRVTLVDLTNPRRPRLWPLSRALSAREVLLTLAFSDEATEVIAVGARGEVGRVDTTTGRLVSRESVLGMDGSAPWGRGSAPNFLAGRFAPEAEAEEGLVLATESGAVVLVDLATGRLRSILDAGFVPGRVTSVDYRSYGTPNLVVGAVGGMLVREGASADPTIQRGPPVSGVAFDFDEGFWFASGEGVKRREVYESQVAPAGPSVVRLESGTHGLVAVYPDGAVGLIGLEDGLALPKTESTPAASFDPQGRLLVAEGYDANHIEKLALLRPGLHLDSDGEVLANLAVRHFRPAPGWWSGAEDDQALYVNDVAADGRLVVAGGQDPTGEAAVLVWDAASGRPLRHLVLGTGGVEVGTPSIVSDVVLLPHKHLLAAYSIVQEVVAIWSTETWELEATVPTGPIGDLSLSPDESTLLAAPISTDEAANEAEGIVVPEEGPGRLLFIDVEDGNLVREAELPVSAYRLAWSPNGAQIAVLDGKGRLGFRSSDGRDDARPPVRLDDLGVAVAWRPDGKAVAVALRNGGIVMVDPESGAVSPPLPFELYAWSPSLSWSPDGVLLAATTAGPEEEEEGLDPGPAAIWALGAARLEQRMCRLAGGPVGIEQWGRLADPSLPYRPLCRNAAQRDPGDAELEDASSLGRLALAYERDDRLFAADVAGHTARIGRLEQYAYPPPAFVWSAGALAWISPGQVHLLREGAAQPESWPCICAGLAWDGGALLSLTRTGRELIRFWPEQRRAGIIRLSRPPGFAPSLLGLLGETAVLSGYGEKPTRATPGELFLAGPKGRVHRLPRRLEGTAYGHVVTAAAGDAVALIDGVSAGVCYSTSRIGVLRQRPSGGVGLSFPPMPFGAEPQWVRSIQVAANGSVAAAIAPIGCEGPVGPETAQEAVRYELRGGRWRPTGERGWDVQQAASGLAFLSGERNTSEPDALTLALGGDGPMPVSSDVDALAGRP